LLKHTDTCHTDPTFSSPEDAEYELVSVEEVK
jgi:hypothetical protein